MDPLLKALERWFDDEVPCPAHISHPDWTRPPLREVILPWPSGPSERRYRARR